MLGFGTGLQCRAEGGSLLLPGLQQPHEVLSPPGSERRGAGAGVSGDGNSVSVPSLSLQLGEGLQALALGERHPGACHSPACCPPGNSFVRHNTRQLTRVYPLGLRMNSANYSPQEMWNSGCQLGEWGRRAGSGQGAAL